MRALENVHKVSSLLKNGQDIVGSVSEPCWCVGDILPIKLVDLYGTEGVSNKDQEETVQDVIIDDDPMLIFD